MAQTKQYAKNTFGEGLIMDFAPDNTLANVLTNALNATLLTFNGNEMSLLNDMGNARVESAFLPEGYIPVGTCEFGDIIYIVSYNPLENKSQIGCFPSPERNIASTEVSNIKAVINEKELTQNDGGSYKINSSTVKKIIFGNKNINTGDKFVISWGNDGVGNFDVISNFGNESKDLLNPKNYWPKLTKIHVVALEDSGKITYLDDSVVWYDYPAAGLNTDKGPFYIASMNLTNESTVSNLDTYREALQCQYSVFLARTSGKLALLLELETINGFNCGHKIIKRKGTLNEQEKEYFDIYLSTYWDTDNYNINPCGFLISSSELSNRVVPVTTSSENEIQILKADDHRRSSNKLYIVNNEGKLATNVIDYTRLYKMEEPLDSYKEFLKKSFYTNENLFETISPYSNSAFSVDILKRLILESPVNNVIRAYTIDSGDGASIPSTYKSGENIKINWEYPNEEYGCYVANVNSAKFENNSGNLTLNYYISTKDLNLLKMSDSLESGSTQDAENSEAAPLKPRASTNRFEGAIKPEESFVHLITVAEKFKANVNELKAIPSPIPDDIIVNKFKKPVLKYVGSVMVDETISTLGQLDTITYTVSPCMPYGPLEHLAVTNTINLSNDSGKPELTTWKYYTNAFSTTLSFGFNTHLGTSSDEAVGKISMEFFDNSGLCATYTIDNQESYDAIFTEYFALDTVSSNFRLSRYTLDGNLITRTDENTEISWEDAKIDSNKDSYLYKKIESDGTSSYISCGSEDFNKILESNPNDIIVYPNTSGILYYGRPYLVKIYIYVGTVIPGLNTIEYTPKLASPEPIYRWLWTAPIFNDYFVDTQDFNDLLLECSLDAGGVFDGSKLTVLDFSIKNDEIDSSVEDYSNNMYKGLAALVKKVNGLITFSGYPVLAENYNNSIAFNPTRIPKELTRTVNNMDYYENVEVTLGVNSPRIELQEYSQICENLDFAQNFEEIKPIVSTDYDTIVGDSRVMSDSTSAGLGIIDINETPEESPSAPVTGLLSPIDLEITKLDLEPEIYYPGQDFYEKGLHENSNWYKYNIGSLAHELEESTKKYYPITYGTSFLFNQWPEFLFLYDYQKLINGLGQTYNNTGDIEDLLKKCCVKDEENNIWNLQPEYDPVAILSNNLMHLPTLEQIEDFVTNFPANPLDLLQHKYICDNSNVLFYLNGVDNVIISNQLAIQKVEGSSPKKYKCTIVGVTITSNMINNSFDHFIKDLPIGKDYLYYLTGVN